MLFRSRRAVERMFQLTVARTPSSEQLSEALALVSINLGLLKLLPVPVLDGGHLLFFAIEGALRRPLPLRVREVASLCGVALLLALMGVALKNDVDRRWDVLSGYLHELLG